MLAASWRDSEVEEILTLRISSCDLEVAILIRLDDVSDGIQLIMYHTWIFV